MKNKNPSSETALKFGEKVKYLRQMKKMTQAELAAELGLSIRQVRRIEQGETTPQFSMMEKLCHVLDVNMLQLFMFKDEAATIPHNSVPFKADHDFEPEENIVAPKLVGVWSINPQTSEMHWTSSIYEFLEYSRYSVKPTLKRFLHRVQPHDREALKLFIDSAFNQNHSSKIFVRVNAGKATQRNVLIIKDQTSIAAGEHNSVQMIVLDVTDLLKIQNQLRLNKEQLEQILITRNKELKEAVKDARRELKLRVKAEEKARENEARFRFIAENAPVGLLTLDRDMNVHYLSRTFVEVFGYDINDFSCVKEWLPLAYPDEDLRSQVLENWNKSIKRAAMTKSPIEPLQYPVTCKDGAVRYVEFRASPPEDFIVTALIDITEQKAAEQALREREVFVTLLMNLAKNFINIPLKRMGKAINEMLEQIGCFARTDRVYIFEHDHGAQTTSNTYEWCAPDIEPEIGNLQAVPFNYFSDILEIHAKNDPFYVSDVHSMPGEHKMRKILLDQGIISLILVPLHIHGENVGFVGFDSVKEKRIFSKDEIDLLKIFAQIISNILFRYRNEEKPRVRETARHSTE